MIECDDAGKYSLTTFGQAVCSKNRSIALPTVVTFDAYSSIAPIEHIWAELPAIRCFLVSSDADTIISHDKRVDLEYFMSQNNFQPRNEKRIQVAAARLIDELLDAKAASIGVDGTQSEENVADLNANLPFALPGYDSIKRLQKICDTDLKIFCEFDGKAWLKLHNMKSEELKQEEAMRQQREGIEKTIRSMGYEERLKFAVDFLSTSISTDKDDLTNLESKHRLFKSEVRIRETVSRLLDKFIPEAKGKKFNATLQLLEKKGILRFKRLDYYDAVIDPKALNRFVYEYHENEKSR